MIQADMNLTCMFSVTKREDLASVRGHCDSLQTLGVLFFVFKAFYSTKKKISGLELF